MKSLARKTVEFLARRETVRIAVCGSKNCGKTVFLTALADHLVNHDPGRFDLKGWTVVEAEVVPIDETRNGFVNFPYEESRASLANGEWPRKTRGVSVLRLELRLVNGRKRRRVRLEVLDLPGERVADFGMANRDYGEWCACMNRQFKADAGYQAFCACALEALRKAEAASSELDLEVLSEAYRGFLAQCYGDHSPLITPSLLRLSLDGRLHGGKTPADFLDGIRSLPVGLDADRSFLPLPPEFLASKNRGVAKVVSRFRKAYGDYKDRVVSPVTDWLSSANQLYYLVDVFEILNAGVDAYNSACRMGEAALDLFNRSRDGLLRKAFCCLFRSTVNEAYLVATKSDQALDGQSDPDNMGRLLDRMLGRKLNGLDLQKCGVRTCAAVRSTVTVEASGVRRLQGVFEKGGSCENSVVDAVPPAWPPSAEWTPGRFHFYPVFPRFDGKRNEAPPQRGLDALARSMLHV